MQISRISILKIDPNIKNRFRRWYWRTFVPRPNTLEPGGFEKYVEWCRIREETETIITFDGFENNGEKNV